MHTIIFFIPNETLWLRDLMHETALRLPHDVMTTCRTAEELVDDILTTSSEARTVVLATLTHHDLSLVLSFKGMLKCVRNLLILPDDTNETLSKALPLQACYHTSVNGNPDEVVAVLEKISQYLSRCSTGHGQCPHGVAAG